jgi:hypothetical protein
LFIAAGDSPLYGLLFFRRYDEKNLLDCVLYAEFVGSQPTYGVNGYLLPQVVAFIERWLILGKHLQTFIRTVGAGERTRIGTNLTLDDAGWAYKVAGGHVGQSAGHKTFPYRTSTTRAGDVGHWGVVAVANPHPRN